MQNKSLLNATPQREFALQVVRQLRDAGHEALWAGGCVRDELLGIAPKDYDVATSARPAQVRELFGKKRTLAIGAAFGVISVLGGKDRDPIEVATFRSDGAYLDGRHPSEVVFTTAEEDAQRRDFTINGLFYDPVEDKLIDYVSGERDLTAGVVRAIGDAHARFAEDKLRMLRAVRFATTYELDIDPTTLAAIRSMADEVNVVSAERIGVELRKIFTHNHRSRGLRLLRETGLLDVLLPSVATLASTHETEWSALLQRLDALDVESLSVAFALLLVASRDDADAARRLGKGFRFTNKEVDRTAWLVETVDLVSRAPALPWPALQRVLVHPGASDLVAMAAAIDGADSESLRFCRERMAWPAEKFNPEPLLTGDDLVAAGFAPGKYFGDCLTFVRDAQLEGTISDRPQALDLATRWINEQRTT